MTGRPVAVAMAFLAAALCGAVAWSRLPVELLPPLAGDELFVSFTRPGSEPEVVERELLVPLEGRLSELSGVRETTCEIRGSSGTLRIQLERGTDMKVRELQLRQIAASLRREQPRGTVIEVSSFDVGVFAQIVMFAQVSGGEDQGALRDLCERRVVPRLVAVPGVGRVQAAGGNPLEARVEIDPTRCAAQGLRPEDVVARLSAAVSRLRYVGGAEVDATRRTAVVVDARPRGPVSLAELPLGGGVRLSHVADVAVGAGRADSIFRVDGRPAVGLVVFKEQGANLVDLGRTLRARLASLGAELSPYGLRFSTGFDAAKLVEDQLDRLRSLALSGFAIALVVLVLFLRQPRAVLVLGISVPASLLLSVGLLALCGLSINLVTLFGLAVAVGMLVDNSIVVYEATQRQLERGAAPDVAASRAVQRTLRAMVAATVTNAVVFLPLLFTRFDDPAIGAFVAVLAQAYVIPQFASLVVAVGLVPLCARTFAAPAALRAIAAERERRADFAGIAPPDRMKELFAGALMVALRRPAGWLTGVAGAVLVTAVIAVPWVAVTTFGGAPPEAEEVRLDVDLPDAASLAEAGRAFEQLERAASGLPGVREVQSFIREGGGTLTVRLVDRERRPPDASAERVREAVEEAAAAVRGMEIRRESGGGDGGDAARALLGSAPAKVTVTGPDATTLLRVAEDIRERLRSIDEVGFVRVGSRGGTEEVHVVPDPAALGARGLMPESVLRVLGTVRREGVVLSTGLTLADGREIPLTARRPRADRVGLEDVLELPLAIGPSAVPLGALARATQMPGTPPILRHDGRREISVEYELGGAAPQSGPSRQALDQRIAEALRELPRPPGYGLQVETGEQTTNWFRRVAVPAVLLLFAVLAITFESLTLPALVLLALPLTLIGAAWGLLVAGMRADAMALVGAVALLGLTVNPAILLVDRMQERLRAGASPGAAALAAVRERVRPVLMTTAATVAGLWPLALVTGRENEIWPPFATVVIGGLSASTLLTLLVTPVGFVLLRRIDALFGRVGPWLALGWLAATAAVVAPLFVFDVVASLTWQTVTLVLVGALLLGAIVLLRARQPWPEPSSGTGADGAPLPPELEVRFLHKAYGRPGPIGLAFRAPEVFARRVLARGGRPFDPASARRRTVPLALLGASALYLALFTTTPFWRTVFAFVAAFFGAALLREVRRARGRVDAMGVVAPGGIELRLAALAPWVAFGWVVVAFSVVPWLDGTATPASVAGWTWFLLLPALCGLTVALVQGGRRTALALARGTLRERAEGRLRRPRTLWRKLSRRVFGFDLPVREVPALTAAQFRVTRGMVGILGPNGAGKTTLLRCLAGVLEPSRGVIRLGGVRLPKIRRVLARWVGYLPQEFGLPQDLTAREYLEQYALQYDIGPESVRRERIDGLLDDVGLAARAHEPIGSYSGGMKQRVAVARTLLRLPPVIIVDEPTVGLDPRERIRFRNLLARLSRGRIVLFSTHVVEDVAVACERVIVFAGGKIVYDGATAGLADLARDRTFTVRLAPGEPAEWAPGTRVTDEIPEPDGGRRCRLLAAAAVGGPPHPRATAVPPTLEDGYLLLVQTPPSAASGPAAGPAAAAGREVPAAAARERFRPRLPWQNGGGGAEGGR